MYIEIAIFYQLVYYIFQVELTGNSIFEYIHNYDQDEMNAILSLHPHINQHPVSTAYNTKTNRSSVAHFKCWPFPSRFLYLSLSLCCWTLVSFPQPCHCTHATGCLSQLPTARPDAHAHRQSEWRPAPIRLWPRSWLAHHRNREDLLPADEMRAGQKECGPHHFRFQGISSN